MQYDHIMIAIELSNVYKTYQLQHQKTLKDLFQSLVVPSVPNNETVDALSDINIQIDAGESVGLIGRNGAGKTTLLKLISQVSAPSSGTVVVNGKVVPLLGLGAGFHPRLTARENIFLNGSILGMDKDYILSVYKDIVEFSEIDPGKMETPIRYFSSGMYSRLAFSVSIFVNPDILILDEVFSVGDISFKEKSEEKIKEIINSGVTCLFVSHSMESIKMICDRAIYLEEGKLKYDGKVDKAIAMYKQDVRAGKSD